MAGVSFKTVTLSETEWAAVTAPQDCSYFFLHTLGDEKPSYVISSDTSDPEAQDVVESDWTMDVPVWTQPWPRWSEGTAMFWLKATAGGAGTKVGVTFL